MTPQPDRPESANAVPEPPHAVEAPVLVRYVIAGAGGGQGTTTIAVALAALSSRRHTTTLTAHDRDAVCALVGIGPEPPPGPVELAPGLTLADAAESTRGVAVVDAGSLRRLRAQVAEPVIVPVDEHRWLVVRGPCYLSLRAAVTHPWRPHGVVLLTEPRRALSARDVANVLGTPVVAEIPQDHRVARAIDAGTFLATVGRLEAFAGLRGLVPPRGLLPEHPERPAPGPGTPARRMSERLDYLDHPSPGIERPFER